MGPYNYKRFPHSTNRALKQGLLALSSIAFALAHTSAQAIECGWSSGRWVLDGANGAARSASYVHPLGTIQTEFNARITRGALWNYPSSSPHLYTKLFPKSDWAIENQSILGFSHIAKLNDNIISLDLTAFPQQHGLVFGLENLATYLDNPYRYRLVLLDDQGNTVAPGAMTLIGTEKSPNTGGSRLGLYDEEVAMDANGVLNVNVIGSNSLNTRGIFWKNIPQNVATIQIHIQGATAYYSDFVRLYLGTPDYCPTPVAIKAPNANNTFRVKEGQRTIGTLETKEPNLGSTLNWQIIGGANADLFDIDQSGTLSFKQAPDFETPLDSADTSYGNQPAGDNVYALEVNVQDSVTGTEANRTVFVQVDDVAPVAFSGKVLLRGAYSASDALMRDDLRRNNLIPLQQPYATAPFQYSGQEALAANLLTVDGEQALVDWVLVDFRAPQDLHAPVLTRAMLVQRDGDLVDPMTGNTTHSLELPSDFYYVSVRHRNHLGVMTAQPLRFSTTATATADFSSADLAVRGDSARYHQASNGTYLLWAGDINQDQRILLNGNDVDQQQLLGAVLMADDNTEASLQFQLEGYLTGDLNLDGKIIFDGSVNDDSKLLFGVNADHPGNTVFTENASLSGGMAGL